MGSTKLIAATLLPAFLALHLHAPAAMATAAGSSNSNLFRDYIGALYNGVRFADVPVDPRARTLWAAHGAAIDYVNFQFYAYGASTTAAKYVSLFDEQIANYPGANILASFTTAATNTSVPVDTALSACRTLQGQGKLYGIFVWAADHSRNQGFKYETQSQALLTDATTY
ncbi:Chitinase 1 [Triticum urartu]|uniref:Chitinase n=2 Tax=Triticum TaxID=4564 RepID=A0A9R0Q740_TRITD|nr:Chitinase 1 [Triticum urartu]VAH03888.1 unnamed protein product [Triticum turgidum subsp. durum]